MATVTQTPTTRSSLLAQLDREWQRLRTSPTALAIARSWARPASTHPLDMLVDGPHAPLVDLDRIIDAVQRRPVGCNDDDLILGRLVELSHEHQLAGRIVIQRLLPALVPRARRAASNDVDPMAIAVPAAWIAIRSYDTARRPRQIAAALVSDAIFQGFRRARRRRSSSEIPAPAETFTTIAWEEPQVPALIELADAIRDAAAAGVAGEELDVIRALARTGSSTLVARDRKVTSRTVRNHRDRAIGHIRRAIAA